MALVYIAGPYSSGDQVVNTRKAWEAGQAVFDRTGAGVLVPHLSLLAHAMAPQDVEYWYAFDLAQLNHCTHLLRIPGHSNGADKEVLVANELGIPVFHDLDELVEKLKELDRT